MRPIFLLAAITMALVSGQGQGKNAIAAIDWNKPFPAHKIIGNVYFVGSEQLGTFLITTPRGHILINTDYEETVPVIRKSVEELGFKFTDIKIILGNHAHPDHQSADAMVKELTAATVMAMAEDVPALKAIKPGNKEHPVDRVLRDGQTVELGGTTLTARLTPGHTKGCTTWTLQATENGKTYDVVIVGSASTNAARLVNNAAYPQIQDDYQATFRILRSLHADVFLGSHNSFYKMTEKYAKIAPGAPNPYIDPTGYRELIDSSEKAYLTELDRQKQAAAKQ